MSSKLVLPFATITLIVLILPPTPVKSSAVLIADFTMSTMIELSSKSPFCKMHTDRGDIQRMLLTADQRRVRQVPKESVLSLEKVCHDTASTASDTANFQGGLGFIYPGTKWCGPGNLATDYSDLGRYIEEDKCCREHDLCPNTLSPGECKKGLCNTGRFTRSHCDCDARFRRCLQGLNTETANTLGAVFFNVVQVTCFRERNPCTTYQRYGCPLKYEKSKFFIPKQGRVIAKIIKLASHNQHHLNDNSGRSLSRENDFSSLNEIRDDSFTSKIGIRLASLGLIVGSFFREMANFNLEEFVNNIITTNNNRKYITDKFQLSRPQQNSFKNFFG